MPDPTRAPIPPDLQLLLRLDARRLLAAVRRPTAGAALGAGLPLLALLGAAWMAGTASAPRLATVEDGVTLGVLLAAPIAFLTYGTLFRHDDDAFLRRLGVLPGALFWERSLRLLGWGLGLVLLVLLVFAAAGAPLERPLGAALAAVLASWGAAVLSLSRAAGLMAGQGAGQGWGCLALGMWDREVAAAAPLVYAPLPALLAGAVAGGIAAAPGAGWGRVLLAGAVSVAIAGAARPAYARAMPRFAPQALEMSFAPPPGAGAEEFHVGRGVARLLPRRAAAVWARDAGVAGRRFAWAARVVWPVAILSVVALARWGEQPATRTWVAGAALLVLLLQGAAILGLGRLERGGRRWIDRAVGIPGSLRFLGRWMWGWGMSLWLAVPLALAWGWWAGGGPGWVWLLAGGGTSAVAALVSTASAGWR